MFFSIYVFYTVTRKQNGEQVFVAANGSGYVIEFMILQHPRVTRFQKYNFYFFGSYRFGVVACTKIGDQVLVAANGSGYVIQYII